MTRRDGLIVTVVLFAVAVVFAWNPGRHDAQAQGGGAQTYSLPLVMRMPTLTPTPLPTATPPPGTTTIVSVSSSGQPGNWGSERSDISADGQIVAFHSYATNLASGGSGTQSVFVHNRATGHTERASLKSDGSAITSYSTLSDLSGDGRYVVFTTGAFGVVEGLPDGNQSDDVFVRDRLLNETFFISLGPDGLPTQHFGHSEGGSISADGRYVVFSSYSSELVPNDPGREDVFIRDRTTNTTAIISRATDGTKGNNHSSSGQISSDGRYVTFVSEATNLVPNDTNNQADVFLHDRASGETRRLSVSSGGLQAEGISQGAHISADGCAVAFASSAANLVLGDTNGVVDIFVHDCGSQQTTRVSIASNGTQANGASAQTSTGTGDKEIDISADGRFVVFTTRATNLVPGFHNGLGDIVMHDRLTGQTTRVSLSSTGQSANGQSWTPAISATGRFVSFASRATNLVPVPVSQSQIYVRDRGP